MPSLKLQTLHASLVAVSLGRYTHRIYLCLQTSDLYVATRRVLLSRLSVSTVLRTPTRLSHIREYDLLYVLRPRIP